MTDSELPSVKKLYYQVIKFYELPVINHSVLSAKINALEKDIGFGRASHYLITLLKRDLREEDFEFKPTLNTGLDIYSKRIKIEQYFTKNNPRQTYIPPNEEE